jgi:hypothetical protein
MTADQLDNRRFMSPDGNLPSLAKERNPAFKSALLTQYYSSTLPARTRSVGVMQARKCTCTKFT